jgi:uncharacterized membrane protein
MDEQQKVQDSPVVATPVSQPKSSGGTGLEPRIAALLCWAFSPLSSLIFVLIEKDNKFVKFHAYQSLLVGIAIIVASIIASILTVVLIGFLLYPVIYIGGFVIWIMGMMKAYKEEKWKLPIVGDMAEEWANK